MGVSLGLPLLLDLREGRVAVAGGALLAVPGLSFGHQPAFTDSFMIEACQFSATGSNPYFVLQPGHRLVLEGAEGKAQVRPVITVLDAVRTVNGIRTRVVEERETHDGELVGARAGVTMPGLNLIGARYFQEVAPDVALDRAETISVSETVSTPGP